MLVIDEPFRVGNLPHRQQGLRPSSAARACHRTIGAKVVADSAQAVQLIVYHVIVHGGMTEAALLPSRPLLVTTMPADAQQDAEEHRDERQRYADADNEGHLERTKLGGQRHLRRLRHQSD